MKKWKLKSKHRMEQQKKSHLNSTVILISIVVIIVGIFGIIIMLSRGNTNTQSSQQTQVEVPENNVSMQDGKQIIEIGAKAGYTPRKSVAKAGVPTILKFKTNGTYDCSSTVRIPALSISENLPGTGTTDIDIGTHQAGKLAGMCGMGMYFFEIDFQA